MVLPAFVVAAHYWQRHHSPQPPSLFQQMTIAQLTSSGNVGPAAIWPDGKWLAYVVAEKQESVWIRQMATGGTVQVIPPSAAVFDNSSLTFSRDGNYLYCVVQPAQHQPLHKRVLEQVLLVGGAPRTILSDIDSPIGFSPDGSQFVFVRDSSEDDTSSLMIANADGSNLHADYGSLSGFVWNCLHRKRRAGMVPGRQIHCRGLPAKQFLVPPQSKLLTFQAESKRASETRNGTPCFKYPGCRTAPA
jgi:WD40-like Beta Propeller Repeat